MSYENFTDFELEGVQGRVVSPAAFIAHKGLTFPRRGHRVKKFKDIYYIVYVSGLYLDLDSIFREIMDLDGFLSGWQKTFQENLNSVTQFNQDDLQEIANNDESGQIVPALVRQVCARLSGGKL